MILLKLLLFAGLAYLMAKVLTTYYEQENEKLKQQLVYVKTKRQKEREEYLHRIAMMNEALNLRNGYD